MSDVVDKLETLILMALDANQELYGSIIEPSIINKGNSYIVSDPGKFLGFQEMRPASSYTFDMADKDRVFSETPEFLMNHPSEIIGNTSEVICFDEASNCIKWIGVRKLNKCPKNVAYLVKATHWYEYHFRKMFYNGYGEYHHRLVPLDKNGNPLSAKVNGHYICDTNIEGVSFILIAGIVEDAHRKQSMLAKVSESTEIKFPVPLGDYKELFSLRDGPLNGNRRKAILHWVSQHLRKTHKGNIVDVKRHTRGIDEFTIDGLRISITPNDYS